MIRAGIYGGTFDPVHNGHLITAQAIRELRRLDKIIFIPAYVSPHKVDMLSASPADRLEMLKSAIGGIDYLEYSDYEIEKGDVSYTYDTLLHLKKEYRNLELIIGYDNLIKFNTWKNPEGILELAKLIVLKRVSKGASEEFNEYFAKAEFVDSPTIEISSTEIRNRVKRSLPIDFLVPDKVKEYIIHSGLYK